ncbi:alkaline shock response membrane anchor protein AmaP [Rathayibacter sp. ZW T2_19]|uniref:Alkaline shock response membrane anchor protein AmaP n=1 Tax=Rathayibacter rubneri TaxID=2950106 RepID=A0A9X2DWA4_9MICO|nr:alkaline shock response membrane anchor protein AmaP [Rathayibacter rubneri]MCM6761406.1 alkaline shock response membrane anchor protein AmaP [Rathayibacter rubneri]
MRIRDWQRLRKKVELLQARRRDISAFGWTAVGLVLSAALTLFPWLPAWRALPEDQQLEFAWVTPAIIVAGVAGIILAIISFIFAHLFANAERQTAKELGDDMDSVYKIPETHQ